MTWKTAIVGVPYGGAKGGINVPAQRPRAEGARAAHPLVHRQDRPRHRADARHPGPGRQHERPGHGLDDGRVRQAPRPHAGVRHRQADPARRLVRPRGGDRPRARLLLPRGGAAARPHAAGDARRRSRASATSAAGPARILQHLGCKIVAIAGPHRRDPQRGRHRHRGARRAPGRRRRHRASSTAPSRSRPRSSSSTECDVFIPAALGGMIHGDNAELLNTRIVLEGANSPTTPKADEILAERDIIVIPDVLANAGGVVVSYFEWVQNLQHFRWDEREVNDKLGTIMRRAYREVSARRQAGRRVRCASPRTRLGHRARRRGGQDARLRLTLDIRSTARIAPRGGRSRACRSPCRRTRDGVGEQPARDLPPGGQGRTRERLQARTHAGALSASRASTVPRRDDDDVAADADAVALDRAVEHARAAHLDALLDAQAVEAACARAGRPCSGPGRRAGRRVLGRARRLGVERPRAGARSPSTATR